MSIQPSEGHSGGIENGITMNREYDISVIIVSYNTREMLRDCLNSVFKETRQASIEVFVVDNGSTDGSCQMVAECFPQVAIIANIDNRGFAAANNQAIMQAVGRYYLLLNSDTVILEGAIDKAQSFADAHPNVGALGPKVLGPNKEHQSTVFRFPSLKDLLLDATRLPDMFPRNGILNHSRYASLDWEHEHDVNAVAGCFLMVRRTIVDHVGALDEDFFMYGEEAEWCHRIWKAGGRIVYFPGAKIIHIWGGSSKGSLGSAKAQLAKRRATLLVMQKTRGAGVAWMGNLIMLMGLPPRLLVWLMTDIKSMLRSDKSRPPFASRLSIIRFHATGLFRPVWCKRTGSQAVLASVNLQ